jgi:hypothetical protein
MAIAGTWLRDERYKCIIFPLVADVPTTYISGDSGGY